MCVNIKTDFKKDFGKADEEKSLYSVQVPRLWQWGLQGLWGEAGAVPNGTQTDLMDPPQGTCEPLRQDGGASGKMCLIQGKQCHSGRGEGRKPVRNRRMNTKFREEAGAPGATADIHTADHGQDHARQDRYFRRELPSVERPCWSRGKLWAACCFNIYLCFLLSASDLIENKLIYLSQVCFAHTSNW